VTPPAALAFGDSLRWLVEPALAELRSGLAGIPGLAKPEREILADGAAVVLAEIAHRRACRVLVLELHAARLGGQLKAGDPAGRWNEYLELSAQPRFWEALAGQYPPLLPRLREQLARRRNAMLTMAGRLAAVMKKTNRRKK